MYTQNYCLVQQSLRICISSQKVCFHIPLSAFLNQASSGIILSGSPYSVYDKDSPHVDLAVFDLGVPILGICYGLQVIVSFSVKS